jgi:hypothetical protein
MMCDVRGKMYDVRGEKDEDAGLLRAAEVVDSYNK